MLDVATEPAVFDEGAWKNGFGAEPLALALALGEEDEEAELLVCACAPMRVASKADVPHAKNLVIVFMISWIALAASGMSRPRDFAARQPVRSSVHAREGRNRLS